LRSTPVATVSQKASGGRSPIYPHRQRGGLSGLRAPGITVTPDEETGATALGDRLADSWPLPTALAWFVFAPQCLSTIAVARRETNGWKWPIVMIVYLFAAACAAAGLAYWGAKALGL
jgi:Fe2+ transport system protein B